MMDGQIEVVDGRFDINPAVVYLAGLSPGSQPTMRQALNTVAQLLAPGEEVIDYLGIPWQRLRFEHTAAIRSQLEAAYSYRTANKMLSAVRGVLKAAWKLGLLTADEYHTASSVENISGQSVPAGRSLQSGELGALLATCKQDRTGIRDAAILAVLYACGLRRAEIVGLDLKDYSRTDATLRVRGKRNKERLAPMIPDVETALTDWLRMRGSQPGPLFIGTGNRNSRDRLTTQAVYKMLQTRGKKAGIPKLSPHDFRRSFVGDLLDAGADIVIVQKLAGHANVETTSRYDRRGEEHKRKAAERLSDKLSVEYNRQTLEI